METTINWFALSNIVRTDFVKKLEFTNVIYMEHNWGFGTEIIEKIVKTVQ